MPASPSDSTPRPDPGDPTEISGEAPTLCDPEATTRARAAFAQASARSACPVGDPEESRHDHLGSLGKGGMGEVLLVRDVRLERQEAMKVISEEEDPIRVARFLREARVTARLEHPNIVPIHDVGRSHDGRLYFTMKRVRGRSLLEILTGLKQADPKTEAAYPLSRLLEIFLRVCHGVAYAHAQGVVHRDLKPANIMIGDFDEVLVMDWGLAKELRQPEPEPSGVGSSRGPAALDISSEGSLIGTLRYMPPEQAEGRLADIGPRSDIYALGAILYELLSLEYAQPGAGRMQVLVAIVEAIPAPPAQRAPQRFVPRELSAVALRALQKDPQRRYASVRELQSDVRAYLEGRRGRAWQDTRLSLLQKWVRHNRSLAAASLVAILLAVALLAGLAYSRVGPGSLRLRSQPPGALIWLDGEAAGQTDAELGWIWPGTHRVRLELSGYDPWEGSVEMAALGQVGLERPLLPDHGFLSLRCDAATRVLLDAHEVGRGSLDSLRCARGQHLLELQRAEHAPLLRRIEIPAGPLLDLGALSLKRLEGRLDLQTSEAGQRLRWTHADSQRGGELLTPLEGLSLPVGEVELELQGRDIYTVHTTVRIEADKTVSRFLAAPAASLWEVQQEFAAGGEDDARVDELSRASPVFEDLDGDGSCDVLLPGFSGLRALHGNTGRLLFEAPLGLEAARVADVDGDGRNELVGLRQGRIRAWKLPGLQELWRDQLRAEVWDFHLLQGPAGLAVLAVGEAGFAALRAGDGTPLWRAPRGEEVSGIGDLDGDGWDDVVAWIGSRLGWLRGADGTLGGLLQAEPGPAEPAAGSAQAAAEDVGEQAGDGGDGRFPVFEATPLDFAGQGQAEIILLGENAVQRVSPQGASLDGWSLGPGYQCFPSAMPESGPLAMGLWLVRQDGRLFSLAGDPPQLREHCQLSVPGLLDLAAQDIDADGVPELLSLSQDGGFWLRVWQIPGSASEAARALFALKLDAPAYHLSLAELTGDRTPELVVAGRAGPRVLSLPSPSVLWRSSQRVPLAVADLDADGQTDLLCSDWGLQAVDGATGSALWRRLDDERLVFLEAGPEPLLLVAAADGRMFALDPASGRERSSGLSLEVIVEDWRYWLASDFGLARDAAGRRHTLAWARGDALVGLGFDGSHWEVELPWQVEPLPFEAAELGPPAEPVAALADQSLGGGGAGWRELVVEVVPDADADGVEDLLVAGLDRILAFSGRTGVRLWQSRPGSQAWLPATDENGDGVVEILEIRPGRRDPRIQLLRADTGAALWPSALEGTPISAFGLAGIGRCLLLHRSAPPRLVAIDAATANLLWEHRLPDGALCDPQPGLWGSGEGDSLAFAVADGRLLALDARSGDRVWSREGVPGARIEVVNDALCVRSGARVLRLDARQGTCLSSHELAEPVDHIGDLQTGTAAHASVLGSAAVGCLVLADANASRHASAHRYPVLARNYAALLRAARDREAQAALYNARQRGDLDEAVRQARWLLARGSTAATPACQLALAEAAVGLDTAEVELRLRALLGRFGWAPELLHAAIQLAYQVQLDEVASQVVRRLARRGSWELVPPGLAHRQRQALLWALSEAVSVSLESPEVALLGAASLLLEPHAEPASLARVEQQLLELSVDTELQASAHYLLALLHRARNQPGRARHALETVPRALRPSAFETALQDLQDSIDRQRLRDLLGISFVARRDPRAPPDEPIYLYIQEFDADSRWARAGLRSGDAILAVDGKWGLPQDELETQLWLARSRRLRLMILRGEREGRLTVEP